MKKLLFLLSFLCLSPVMASDTAIENKIICPKIAEYYISNSKKTILTMKDLVGSLVEIRTTDEELIVSLMGLAKSKVYEERVGGIRKINEIKAVLSEKQKRAKENYNEQLKILAGYSTKIKNCWSSLTTLEKKNVGEFINKFQQNKIFMRYKGCIDSINATNNLYNNDYLQTLSFYNGKITMQQLGAEHSIIAKNLVKAKSDEYKKCVDFLSLDEDKKIDQMEKELQKSMDFSDIKFMKGH